ncbi:MAG: rRNA maturation RNase YbeY [Cyclobacteriaceae bacterium]
MSAVEFLSEDISFTLADETSIGEWLRTVAKKEGNNISSLTYIFCSDEYLLAINKEYLNHNYYTDIITFDNSISDEGILGDIFISIDRVRENASEFNEPLERELNRVIVHGLLHLCGYKDKTETEQNVMRQREDAYISLRLN